MLFRLDDEIHQHVVEHHQDLLSQATGIETLESVLELMQVRMDTLLAAVNKIRARVAEPYERLSIRVTHLRRMQAVCDLLRKAARIFSLTKRLRSGMAQATAPGGSSSDLGKAAQCLNELDYLFGQTDWQGVDVLEADRRTCEEARALLERQAWLLLEQAQAEASAAAQQSQLGASLLVFYHLGSLPEVLLRLHREWRADLEQAMRAAFDVTLLMPTGGTALVTSATAAAPMPSAPGRANLPSSGQAVALRAALWGALDRLFERVLAACALARVVHRVLRKRREPTLHKSLHECLAVQLRCIEEQLSGGVSYAGFLDWLGRALERHLAASAEASSVLKQAFEGEYPKLLRLSNDLLQRLTDAAEAGHEDEEAAPVAGLLGFLSAFEHAYLSRSLSRLFDPIELAFSAAGSPSVPSAEEVANVVRTVASELTFASAADRDLLTKVMRNVTKAVLFLCTKCEALVCVDGSASQVLGPPTDGQATNVNIVNMLLDLRAQLERTLEQLQLPSDLLNSARGCLQHVAALMSSALQPLLHSVGDSLESIVLTMHQEDFGLPAPAHETAACSLYMRELQEFVARAAAQYLAAFRCADFLTEQLRPTVQRLLDLFLIQACLVRPLGEGGKLRLAADCAQLELAVSPLCRRVQDLGLQYRRLRAFRPLLFLTPEHMLASASVARVGQVPTLDAPLPASLILHLLFARAPPELRSPHQAAGWSLSRYSHWLLEHCADQERLEFVRGALQSYENVVRQQGLKNYASVYPIMLQLMQRDEEAAV